MRMSKDQSRLEFATVRRCTEVKYIGFKLNCLEGHDVWQHFGQCLSTLEAGWVAIQTACTCYITVNPFLRCKRDFDERRVERERQRQNGNALVVDLVVAQAEVFQYCDKIEMKRRNIKQELLEAGIVCDGGGYVLDSRQVDVRLGEAAECNEFVNHKNYQKHSLKRQQCLVLAQRVRNGRDGTRAQRIGGKPKSEKIGSYK